MPPVIHTEIALRHNSNAITEEIKEAVESFIVDKLNCLTGTILKRFDDPYLTEHVEEIQICETNDVTCKTIDRTRLQFVHHIYVLSHLNREDEMFEDEEDGQLVNCASKYILPSIEFQGLWESLVYELSLKDSLLNFVESIMLFSDQGVDTNFVSCNRVVLLHGPPGTGKTSLCKGLAQKLSIRLSHRYSKCELLEINTHSLFSKWFSESSKHVMKLFAKIRDQVTDGTSLVCVLIDEVESLAHARHSSVSGLEPSDSVRVVNALITQLDSLKSFPNILVFTTSNITTGIDCAFVDRADIRQYIGPPKAPAIYEILKSCIRELQKSEIISSKESIMHFKLLELTSFQNSESTKISLKLLDISRKCEDLSGRTLRKLPLLAHAYYLQKPSVSLGEFLDALENALYKYKSDCREFQSA